MPDIENPTTYCEWYWKNSVDATLLRSTSYEKTLAPFIADAYASIPAEVVIPPFIKRFMDAVSSPKQPDFDSSVVRMASDIGSGLLQRVLGHEVKEFDYHMAHYLRNVRITHDVANQLFLRKKITQDFWTERNLDAGFSEAEMKFNYEALKPYPTMSDLIAYARYHGDPDNPKELVWSKYDISPEDYPMWEWLSLQKPNTEQILSLYKRKFWTDTECIAELARLGWNQVDRNAVMDLAYSLPNAMLLAQGELFQGVTFETIRSDISKADIHPAYAQTYLDGVMTKPATSDIIAFELRRDASLSNISKELSRIGIHPFYHDLYKELAFQIPPVADIITMAVREAFTPEIAQRFGQYEGLPQPFVEWVAKKGLAKEWAERYWAAHWSLPSPSQGFDMLHRGIITREDLQLLLRALDIMPFWRDKLIQMSYVPLTRIDVRRMYNLGVLSESDVTRAYQDIGYNPQNAQRLTLFTVKLKEQQDKRARETALRTQPQEPKLWTQAQTLKFLKQGLISRERAVQELELLGYSGERISIYLRSIAGKTA